MVVRSRGYNASKIKYLELRLYKNKESLELLLQKIILRMLLLLIYSIKHIVISVLMYEIIKNIDNK